VEKLYNEDKYNLHSVLKVKAIKSKRIDEELGRSI
jgi:hypothetical protein